ncbi:MAG: rhodanese-like domain-containing protein [Halobacteriota archaeon]
MKDKELNARDKSQDRFAYLSPAELARRLRAEPECFVLDVRDPHELGGELGRLPGAVNIPLQLLEQRLEELSTKERGDIIVVCRTGKRSETAARMLQESGFERVFVLKGGMTAWSDKQR